MILISSLDDTADFIFAIYRPARAAAAHPGSAGGLASPHQVRVSASKEDDDAAYSGAASYQ